jgi:hypothetical protein
MVLRIFINIYNILISRKKKKLFYSIFTTKKNWVGEEGGRILFHSPLFPICSFCVPIRFPMCFFKFPMRSPRRFPIALILALIPYVLPKVSPTLLTYVGGPKG